MTAEQPASAAFHVVAAQIVGDAGSAGTGRREEISTVLARAVVEATARRLADAIAEYATALDARASMLELQDIDRDVVRAERDHVTAKLYFDVAVGAAPQGEDRESADRSATAP